MRSRWAWGLAVVLVAGLTGCGAGERRAPGCTAPSNEDALLDTYAEDPVMAVVPEQARPDGGITRSTACIQLNKEDVSNTSVSRLWRLSRDIDEATLRRLYEPVASAGGWQAEPPETFPPPGPADTWLTYCREVGGVPSRLVINARAAQRVDVRPSGPDRPPSPSWEVVSPSGIYLTIFAPPPGSAPCGA